MSNFSNQLGQMTKMGGWWDWVDGGLNAVGMIPGIGTVANGISAAGNALQGNWGQAGLAAAGMIPGVGVMSGAARGAGLLGKATRGVMSAGRAAHALPGMAGAVRYAAPAFRGAQAYAKPLGQINRWGNMAGAVPGILGGGHGQQSPVPQYQPPPTPTPMAQQNPMSGAYDMFKGFFNQGNQQPIQQAQAQAHSLAPQGSIYGNS